MPADNSTPAYFLRTPRLGFRHWSPDDLPLALSLWGDPEVTHLIGGDVAFSEERVKDRLAAEIANLAAYEVQYWPIFRLEDDNFVGCCGLRPFKLEEGIYELGYHLRIAHWRKGFAEEAARAAST